MAGLLGPILFVVVVVGGLGSLPGALIASMLIGILQTFAVAVDYSLLDLRSDDNAEPLAAIARLEEIARQSWVHFRRTLPSAANPHGVLDCSDIDAIINASIGERYE